MNKELVINQAYITAIFASFTFNRDSNKEGEQKLLNLLNKLDKEGNLKEEKVNYIQDRKDNLSAGYHNIMWCNEYDDRYEFGMNSAIAYANFAPSTIIITKPTT